MRDSEDGYEYRTYGNFADYVSTFSALFIQVFYGTNLFEISKHSSVVVHNVKTLG